MFSARITSFLLFFSFSSLLFAVENPVVVKSAVGEKFLNGLQAKYLKYIAKQLNARLELEGMPFSRRIKAMRSGEIDFMVGIQRTEKYQDEFVYIMPAYESLSYRFFALKESQQKISAYEDLHGLSIGINPYSRYFKKFDEDKSLIKVDVPNLRNTVQLLLKKRVDVLIHYEESMLPLLASLNLETRIKKTDYQPEHRIDHYIAISSKSPFISRKDEIAEIVTKAVNDGIFRKIRFEHYN